MKVFRVNYADANGDDTIIKRLYFFENCLEDARLNAHFAVDLDKYRVLNYYELDTQPSWVYELDSIIGIVLEARHIPPWLQEEIMEAVRLAETELLDEIKE